MITKKSIKIDNSLLISAEEVPHATANFLFSFPFFAMPGGLGQASQLKDHSCPRITH